jgi:hypothetical protein
MTNRLNCTICSQSSCASCTSDVCQSCMIGYYLFNNTCVPCPTSCISCQSSRVCDTCRPGFYRYRPLDLQGSTPCQPCNSPCKTCRWGPSLCTSCQEGFLLENSRCINQVIVKFEYKLSTPYQTFIKNGMS